MTIIQQIVTHPLYIFLIGGGGLLAVIIQIVGIVQKKRKVQNKIVINNSKKVNVSDNESNNQIITVSNTEDATVKRNKG